MKPVYPVPVITEAELPKLNGKKVLTLPCTYVHICLNQGLNCIKLEPSKQQQKRNISQHVIVQHMYFTQTARFLYDPIFVHYLHRLGTKPSSCLSCATLKYKSV